MTHHDDKCSFLLFSSAERVTNVSTWLKDADIDCAIVYYGKEQKEFESFKELNLSYLEKRAGTKIDNFLFLISKHPDVLTYDYIIFADEDISISSQDIKTFAAITNTLNATWTQPSHSWSSYIHDHDFYRHKPFAHYEIRDFIEVQFFALKTDLIRETIEHWQHFSTGYGLDLFLSLHLKKQQSLVAVIHSVTMKHNYTQEEQRVRYLVADYLKRAADIEGFICEHFEVDEIDWSTARKSGNKILYFSNNYKAPSWFNKLWEALRASGITKAISKFQLFTRELNIGIGTLIYQFCVKRYYKLKQYTPIDARMPRMPYQVIDFLDPYLRKSGKITVFEFGSGGSTLFFLDRECKVFSVEHDIQYYHEVKSKLDSEQEAVFNYFYIPKDETLAENPLYISEYYPDTPQSFQKYAESIETVTDETFDVVLIDGRARIGCLSHCIEKVNAGGMVILDDTFRKRYQVANDIIPANWERKVFTGLSPWAFDDPVKETTIFFKPLD